MFPAQKFTQLSVDAPAVLPRTMFYRARFSPLSIAITATVVGVQALLTILHFL
jgi:hypothetical protein